MILDSLEKFVLHTIERVLQIMWDGASTIFKYVSCLLKLPGHKIQKMKCLALK